MRQKLARIITNVLNPFLLSLLILVLLSIKSSTSTEEAIKWSLIGLALSVFPVFTVVIYLVSKKKLDGIFINPREQRHRIYLLAILCAVIGYIILVVLDAPQLLVATFAAGLAAVIVFMAINLFWKISLHTAFITASVTVLIIVYGGVAAWTVLLVPLVAWARIEMKRHNPAQVLTGSVLACFIVTVVFGIYGYIW
jgi:membrane-associated phospholipid phosphatase